MDRACKTCIHLESYGVIVWISQSQHLCDLMSERTYCSQQHGSLRMGSSTILRRNPSSGGSRSTDMLKDKKVEVKVVVSRGTLQLIENISERLNAQQLD